MRPLNAEIVDSGGHDNFVSFVNLVGSLVSFFVMLVAFSTQTRTTGPMRDAFGVQKAGKLSVVIESDGLRAPKE